MVRCQRDYVTLTSPRPAFIPSHGIRSGLFCVQGSGDSDADLNEIWGRRLWPTHRSAFAGEGQRRKELEDKTNSGLLLFAGQTRPPRVAIMPLVIGGRLTIVRWLVPGAPVRSGSWRVGVRST